MRKQIALTRLFTLLCFTLIVVGCNKQEDKPPAQEVQNEAVFIHFIDTGNSDAILIQQGEQAALIDGGDNDDEESLPTYTKAQGVERLDYVIATHPDADHIGGLDGVINQMEVKQVLVGNGSATTKTYTDFIEAVMSKGLTPSVPLLHKEFPLGEGTLKIISVANEKDPNNCSLVILYTYGESRMLFMGDADQSIEADLDLEQIGAVDLIKLGHHGSRTSSNREFLKQIKPDYTVITCGKSNKYGHPHKETMDTLQALELPVYRTDEVGTIVFEVTQEGSLKTNSLSGSYLAGNQKEETQTSTKSERVYFTAKGTRYHKKSTCSNIKNPVVGTLDDVGSRTPCEKCYNNNEMKKVK